jgi:WD40 repeat protein
MSILRGTGSHSFSSVFLLSVSSVPLWFVSSAPAADPTYWQDIRPVFRRHCTVCHSQKNLKEFDVSGGLALDTPDGAQRGPRGSTIKVGKSAESVLVQLMLDKDENKRMPLGSLPVPEEQIALIRRWIDTGAKEGEKPADLPMTVVTAPPMVRKLDVVLPTATTPKTAIGGVKPGKIEVALKVGPLAPVAAVAFSPDGKYLAAGTYGRVTIWDLAAVKPAKVLTNVLAAVNDLKFSPDGKLLVVAGGQPSAKGDLRIYQVDGWKLLHVLPGHDDVVAGIVFTVDGKRLASASFDKTVRIWDVAAAKLEQTLTGHSDFVYAVGFSPDGKWLVSASKDRSVKMVDTTTGKSIFTFSGMNEDVLAVAVSPDGKQVVSSGFESNLFIWDPAKGERIRSQGGHAVATNEIAFSKDGKLLVSAGSDRTVKLFDGGEGKLLRTLPVGSIAYAAAISADGKLVASGSHDGLTRLFDAATGRQLLTLLSLPPQGEESEWLAQTPEGYVAGSGKLLEQAQWRMGGQPLPEKQIDKVLRQPDLVVKGGRGETLAVPDFGK